MQTCAGADRLIHAEFHTVFGFFDLNLSQKITLFVMLTLKKSCDTDKYTSIANKNAWACDKDFDLFVRVAAKRATGLMPASHAELPSRSTLSEKRLPKFSFLCEVGYYGVVSAPLAQLVEHTLHTGGVVGSSPTGCTAI
jgi:hypothetical protein